VVLRLPIIDIGPLQYRRIDQRRKEFDCLPRRVVMNQRERLLPCLQQDVLSIVGIDGGDQLAYDCEIRQLLGVESPTDAGRVTSRLAWRALSVYQRKSRVFFIFALPIMSFRRSKAMSGFAFQREIPSKLNRDFYPADQGSHIRHQVRGGAARVSG
jgi:hypothetical protein